MEFFADLFAASYIGDTISKFLRNVGPATPDTNTHPSTQKRNELIDDFISGKSNELVNFFNSLLLRMSLPQLSKRYEVVDLSESYGNLRPYKIVSHSQVHGLYISSYNFLYSQLNNPSPLYINLKHDLIIKIINDLTEKSIRNFSILESWNDPNKN